MEGANSPYRADTAAKRYAAAALLAVAIYNAIEMVPIIYFTFSRFSGLYFWSMVTAVTGVMFNAIGFGTCSLDADTLSLLLSDNSGLTVRGVISVSQYVLQELSASQACLAQLLTLLRNSIEQFPVDR